MPLALLEEEKIVPKDLEGPTIGYVEVKNIIVECRYAEGKFDRLPALAAKLVSLKVDVIVTSGATGTRTAKEETNTIPIVMAQDRDPVASGFVASLARPGGNITGLSTLAPEISGKQLEILKEILPKLSRVAAIGSSAEPGNAQVQKELELAGHALKLQLQYFDVVAPKDIETSFRAAIKGRAEAILVLQSQFFAPNRKQIIDLAAKSRLPVWRFREVSIVLPRLRDGAKVAFCSSELHWGTDDEIATYHKLSKAYYGRLARASKSWK